MAWSLNLPMWMPGQPLTVADDSTQCMLHSQTSFTPCRRGGQSDTDISPPLSPSTVSDTIALSSPLCWCFMPHGLVLDVDFYSLSFLLPTLINSANCQSFAWFLSSTCWFCLSAPRLCKQNLAATGYSGKRHWLTFCRCEMAWSLNLPMWMPGQPLTVADDSKQCAPHSQTSFTLAEGVDNLIQTPHHHFHPQQFQIQSHWSPPCAGASCLMALSLTWISIHSPFCCRHW
jgi:hypothetical protein